MCWGRGSCPIYKCDNEIIWTDGNRVTWSESDRYQLLGSITQGDVSLTIRGATRGDTGTYCCRVEIPGLFNDIKNEIHVRIQPVTTSCGSVLNSHTHYIQKSLHCPPYSPDNLLEGRDWSLLHILRNMRSSTFSFSIFLLLVLDPLVSAVQVIGSAGDTVNLPCRYSVRGEPAPMCWGRGSCKVFGCTNSIIWTDGFKETGSESVRYQLKGSIAQGDLSMTISDVSSKDSGTYCCRIRIPGLANDIKNEITLEIPPDEHVKGSVGGTLTLPCKFTPNEEKTTMCWGRGHCSIFNCYDAVIRTQSSNVTMQKSERYQLLGDIAQGDVSLTIRGATSKDSGRYCCHVEVPGIFNDIRKEITVEVPKALDVHVKGSVGGTVTLPCSYSVRSGTTTMCWGRGSCPSYKCDKEIIWTDGNRVTWSESDRYQLQGSITNGDVSLTIKGASSGDTGTYCCRVEIPGIVNDIAREVYVDIQHQ
ncbi:polymeric immunoglobulin receptor-like [Pelodytes ibericus]